MLTRSEIAKLIERWLAAWNRHDLAGVLQCMTEDVAFQHWNTRVTRGKAQLERLWQPWFAAHGDFRFDLKSLCVDETEQACTFEWVLNWPSPEPNYRGRPEYREGVDIIKLRQGEIAIKRSYISTVLTVEGRAIPLNAQALT
jgi:ketosteroid isomerase-like protein